MIHCVFLIGLYRVHVVHTHTHIYSFLLILSSFKVLEFIKTDKMIKTILCTAIKWYFI